MFINFSNHPHALWSAEQQAAAQRYGTVADLAFPAIDPAADEAKIFSPVKANRDSSGQSSYKTHFDENYEAWKPERSQ